MGNGVKITVSIKNSPNHVKLSQTTRAEVLD